MSGVAEPNALPKLPVAANHQVVQGVGLSKVALAAVTEADVSSAVAIDVAAGATWLEVYANGDDIYIKWGTDAATTAAFDEIVPIGWLRQFVIPRDPATGVTFTAFSIIEGDTGGSAVIVQK